MTGPDDAQVRGVRLTHPDRVLFPEQGVTKRDLAHYFDGIADHMMPYVAGRLVSLVRCPDGRDGECFFQRHGGSGFPAEFRRLHIEQKNGKTEDYLYLDTPEALIAAAQMGVLEIHVWGSRVGAIERPDRIVFDLDPAPDIDFAEVRGAARRMRDALDALELKSYALLTGGKGIHVVVPIVRRHEWSAVKSFAGALAQRFAEDQPDRFVATASKAKRDGRIFIDYLRNDRGATAICPYSPRARVGGPIAWPVSWTELKSVSASTKMSLGTAEPTRHKKDPWEGYFDIRQSPKAATFRALGLKPA